MKRYKGMIAAIALGTMATTGYIHAQSDTTVSAVSAATTETGNGSLTAGSRIIAIQRLAEAGNWGAVADAVRQITLSDNAIEESVRCDALWFEALAAYHLNDPGAKSLLSRFISDFPADPRANNARLLKADLAFFSNTWPEALSLYREADIDGLGQPDRSLYSYRLALSLIKTGHYAEARNPLRNVKGKEYSDVRNFYTAYLDYIEGDFNRAYKGFEKVTPGIKGLDAGYYMLQILYTRGDYEAVTSRADRMMKRNPVPELTAEMHRITGLSYFKLNEPDLARISLLNYMSQNQSAPDAEALYALGCIDYDNGDYSEAENLFSQVTSENGELAHSAWLYIGQCRLQQDDIQGATLALEKASAYESDPDVAQTAMYDYVAALCRGGSIPFGKSAEMLEAYLTRWPDSPHYAEVEEYLASAYFNDHNYTAAVDCVDKSPRPTAAMLAVKQKALYEQGVREATNGNVSASASWFEKAAAMRSTDATVADQALLWLADARYDKGNYKQAARDYTAFIKNAKPSSNRTLALYNLAYSQFQNGDYSLSASTFGEALGARPALTKTLADDAHIRRADCLYYTGDYATANKIYGEAIDRKSADSDYAAYRRAVTTGLSGDARAKVQALGAFINQYPDSKWVSAALLEKALTHEELGETQLASECYRKRLALTPDADLDELLRMAQTTDKAGDAPADQLQLLDRIRRKGNLAADEMADIDLYEANAHAALGHDAEADEIYERLSKNPAGLPGAVSAVTLADRLNNAGNYQQAYDLMTSFTDKGTPHTYWLARGFMSLADACAGLGRPELAREYLLSLRDNYPGNEPDILSGIEQRLNKLAK